MKFQRNLQMLVIVGCIFSTSVFALEVYRSANSTELVYYEYNDLIFADKPDVKGYVSVPESADMGDIKTFVETDSFSVYPNWPITFDSHILTGGGIFAQMDEDDDLEIVIYIGYMVQALNIDGSNVPGWPQQTSEHTTGPPSYGDIDGDGDPEIVVISYSTGVGTWYSNLYAFELDGSYVNGFPVPLTDAIFSHTPVLADLDEDSVLEIIVCKRIGISGGEVYVYRGDGTILPGWPQSLNECPGADPAVGDIDGDEIPEIIVASYDALFAWNSSGSLLPGFPFRNPGNHKNSFSNPVLADLDDDGFREILYGTHNFEAASDTQGYVIVLRNDGELFPGWPQAASGWIYSPPSVGYIDDDDVIDICIGDKAVGMMISRLYAWSVNGEQLEGFPVDSLYGINAQVTLADFDGDDMTELITDNNGLWPGDIGYYHAYNHDGTPVDGWPIEVTGWSMMHTLSLNDANSDGYLDVTGGGRTSSPSLTNLYLWSEQTIYNPDKIYVPCYQYNVRHDGVADSEEQTKINDREWNSCFDYELIANFPNPFNASTIISFELSKAGFTSLTIFDITGREVESLVTGQMSRGYHEVVWDAKNMGSGVYFVRMEAERFVQTQKLLLIK